MKNFYYKTIEPLASYVNQSICTELYQSAITNNLFEMVNVQLEETEASMEMSPQILEQELEIALKIEHDLVLPQSTIANCEFVQKNECVFFVVETPILKSDIQKLKSESKN